MKIEDLKKTLETLKNCPNELREATGFQYSVSVDYIKRHTHCDSSEFKDFKAEFVRKATVELIDKSMDEILKRAAEIAQAEYDNIKG